MNRGRRILFWCILALFVLATPPALLTGYYAVRKLTFLHQYCGSYGQLDPVLGWRLKPGARSCLSGKNPLTGDIYFDSEIHVNRDGFRDVDNEAAAPRDGVVAIGDSWTFSYGLDQAQSYPQHLSALLGRPVLNAGVPAYGSAQVQRLFERQVLPLRPKVIIYLTIGLWNRSICDQATRPDNILKPCYWWDDAKGRIELVEPTPGYVEAMGNRGIYPGGYLTAGHDSWAYFLISRPVLLVRGAIERLERMFSLEQKSGIDGFDREAMFRFELTRYRHLARERGFTFILVDPEGSYVSAVANLNEDGAPAIVYVGPKRWRKDVGLPANKLPEDQQRVPKDGHFGEGKNRLIAEMLSRVIQEQGLLPQ